MAITIANTNYNGDVSKLLYSVIGVGNELAAENCVYVETGVATTKALPRFSRTGRSIGAHVATPVTADATGSTVYSENILTVGKTMHYEEYSPEDFADIWPEWQSVGDATNLRMNPTFWAAYMELHGEGIGEDVSRFFWQGDTLSGDASLNFADGIIKLATADASIIDVVNVGVITKANVVSIVEAVWSAIPSYLRKREHFCIHMSQNDFDLLQLANNDAKKTTVGVLSEVVENLFLQNHIKSFIGMPKDVIIAAQGFNSPKSNLVLGVWVDPINEVPKVDYIAPNSDDMFIKINFKLGAQYRAGEEIVMYKGAAI